MARTWRQTWMTVFGVTVVLGALLVIFLPSPGSRPASPRSTCKNNLKQIGLALLAYEQTYGSLPPAYIANKYGKPIHSWRVLLLPFWEQEMIYNLYDFNQPWDSPHNSKLANSMPSGFRCAAADDLPDGLTNYIAVSGPGRNFDGAHATRLSEISDGIADTIMVIEVPDSQAVPWFSPFEPAITTAASNHIGGANAIFVDGSVSFLPSDMPAATMTALQTIAGGEQVQLDD